MRFLSLGETFLSVCFFLVVSPVSLALKCDCRAVRCSIAPPADTENRFPADLVVFCLGMFSHGICFLVFRQYDR